MDDAWDLRALIIKDNLICKDKSHDHEIAQVPKSIYYTD